MWACCPIFAIMKIFFIMSLPRGSVKSELIQHNMTKCLFNCQSILLTTIEDCYNVGYRRELQIKNRIFSWIGLLQGINMGTLVRNQDSPATVWRTNPLKDHWLRPGRQGMRMISSQDTCPVQEHKFSGGDECDKSKLGCIYTSLLCCMMSTGAESRLFFYFTLPMKSYWRMK